MALDNPSYFSVTGEDNNFDIIRSVAPLIRKMGNTASGLDSVSSSSDCSLSKQLTPPNYQNKKQIRSLMRSISSNSADSNQELLIMGEPRLSDIAPDLTYKSNSLKSSKIGSDSLYAPLPASEEAAIAAEKSDDEEVFLIEDCARYYNFQADANLRRHSIGTFMSRERTGSVSLPKNFKEEPPQAIVHATADGEAVKSSGSVIIDDHSLRHASYPRKRCKQCIKGPPRKRGDADDILIISLKNSQAATLWVDYFASYFHQISKQANRRPFKVHHLGAEDVNESSGDFKMIAERTAGVKLQLIVMCPSLLDHISLHPNSSAALGKLIMPDKTLALLLGVSDDDLTDIHRKALPSYSKWQRLTVGQDQDEHFTKEFLNAAMTIFSKVWKQQISSLTQEKSLFSVLPKKVRHGQNGVIILLQHPLQKEDIVKVSVEKNNEIIEVKSVKRRNQYTLKITVPEVCIEVSAIVNILVEKNGSIIGSRPIKCESRLRELEQILRSSDNPVEFMCQALGFSPSDPEHLDNFMVHTFQKNLPPNFNLLANRSHTLNSSTSLHRHSHEEFSTLLHFAARFGLEKLSMQLLDCPGGDVACDVKNASDMTPAEIAENAGHSELAHTLRGYMKMNEFTSMYAKLKEMSQSSSKTDDAITEIEEYLVPNEYKICPPPRPISPMSSDRSSNFGYMTMISSAKSSTLQLPLQQSTFSRPKTPSQNSPTRDCPEITKPKNFEACDDKVQQELLEIINDFKNNVHSISQAEKLVDEWKNRNDVQKSFQEKQQQLNEMRTRYDNIQQDLKSDTKKSSPFDRIRKFFVKGKHKEEEKKTETVANVSTTPPIVIVGSNQRPMSSLSLQSTSSSGSSGRMSTISGCSLGDSGTHSDHEERKQILNGPDEFRNELNKVFLGLQYMIPPPPKPFLKPGMLLNKNKPFETIEERPPQPIPRPALPSTDEDYYIHFPPSGLPVEASPEQTEPSSEPAIYLEFSDSNKDSPDREYMNVAEMAQTKQDLHEYMNLKTAK